MERSEAELPGGPPLPSAVERTGAVVRSGPLEMDLQQLSVRVSGRPLALSALQTTLLLQLARHQNEVLSRERLRADIWGAHGHERDLRVVDVLVCRLRSRLGVAEYVIQSIRPHGYRLRAEPS